MGSPINAVLPRFVLNRTNPAGGLRPLAGQAATSLGLVFEVGLRTKSPVFCGVCINVLILPFFEPIIVTMTLPKTATFLVFLPCSLKRGGRILRKCDI